MEPSALAAIDACGAVREHPENHSYDLRWRRVRPISLSDRSGTGAGSNTTVSVRLLAVKHRQMTAMERKALRLVVADLKVPTFDGHLNQSNTG